MSYAFVRPIQLTSESKTFSSNNRNGTGKNYLRKIIKQIERAANIVNGRKQNGIKRLASPNALP